ncbi:TSUP family transporter [Cellulomonas marina]|uniref:Probable membrane transporter protein n=1 Tax=Cellulomonas marina TaxID=988821 RepID=A0A1I0ZJM9_9CELL|nr:TSUP family transporter [Cellulomonas marina]SFB24730.1 hypothetical protein SAMN05421867_11145 [Cellulomonas marina]
MTLEPLVLGTLAAVVFGMSRTGVPSLGAFGMALLATAVDPVRAAGLALPVLIVGDLVALRLYARSARLRLLVVLLPSVVVGLAAGWAVLRFLDAGAAGRLVGAVLLVSGGWELLRRVARRRADHRATVRAATSGPVAPARTASPVPAGLPTVGDRLVRGLLGAGAGLSTMVANAGGPLMGLYLLRARLGPAAFLGTNAWFFFVVNLAKVPFSVGLGLITPGSLALSAALLPGLVLGAVGGRWLVRRMSFDVFGLVVLVATVVAGAWLVVR